MDTLKSPRCWMFRCRLKHQAMDRPFSDTLGKFDEKKVTAAIKKYNDIVAELERLKANKEEKQETKPPSRGEKWDELRIENGNLKRELEAMKTRLSKRLTEGNAMIADLSDPNRPTALAVKFKSVYDDQWVHAYEDLEKLAFEESDRLKILADIIKRADQFCEKVFTQTMARIGDLVLDDITRVKININGEPTVSSVGNEANDEDIEVSKKLLKQCMKELRHLSIRGLVNLFDCFHLKKIMADKRIKKKQNGINDYAQCIVTYIWYMKLTDPPMVLRWQENGEPFSKEISLFYTKTGKTVQYSVWPTVLLHRKGPVVQKGVVVAN